MFNQFGHSNISLQFSIQFRFDLVLYVREEKKQITTIDYIIAKIPNHILTLHVNIAFFVSFDTVVGFSKLLSTTFTSLFQYMLFFVCWKWIRNLFWLWVFIFNKKANIIFLVVLLLFAKSITSYNASFLLSFWWPIVWELFLTLRLIFTVSMIWAKYLKNRCIFQKSSREYCIQFTYIRS